MIRFLLFAVVAVALVLLALLFSQNPDWTARFEAFGYRLTLHFGLLVFAALLLLWAFGWIYFLFRRTLAMPAEVARNARISRQNRADWWIDSYGRGLGVCGHPFFKPNTSISAHVK